MPQKNAELACASLHFDEDGTPYSTEYQDVYFSRDNGIAESQHVFLNGTNLQQNWKNNLQHTVLELGFGTSLNFLNTWKLWQTDPQASKKLHYIAIEKHPFRADDLRRIYNRWPTLAPFYNKLIGQYPDYTPGFHTLTLIPGCLHLTLCFLPVEEALAGLAAKINTFYLDGFSPKNNPSMWTPNIFQQLGRLAEPKARAATFSAARVVKGGLQEAGFNIQKIPGYGQKREMITATFINPKTDEKENPVFALTQSERLENKSAWVIGAGIAGAQMAYALAIRGWQVTVWDNAGIASGASGNSPCVIAPKLISQPSLAESFYRSCDSFTRRQLDQFNDVEKQTTGQIQICHSRRETERLHALENRGFDETYWQSLDRQQASDVAGFTMPSAGGYLPNATLVDPQSWCRSLLNHPNIQCHLMMAPGEKPIEVTAMIYCNAGEALMGHQPYLPFQWVRGQSSCAMPKADTEKINTIIAHRGYFTPAWNGQHHFGASYQRDITNTTLMSEDTDQNLRDLKAHVPELAAMIGPAQNHFAGIRAGTPDRLPYVGPMPDWKQLHKLYSGIEHGLQHRAFPDMPCQQGVYVFSGFGSRGMTTAPLCAEFLAAHLNQEPLPILNKHWPIIAPQRHWFRIRK